MNIRSFHTIEENYDLLFDIIIHTVMCGYFYSFNFIGKIIHNLLYT